MEMVMGRKIWYVGLSFREKVTELKVTRETYIGFSNVLNICTVA